MKWLILDHNSAEYGDLAVLTAPNHLAYCKRNGYDYFTLVCSRSEDGVYYNLNYKMLRYLLPLYDAIMTIGTDVLFMNYGIRLENIFPPEAEQQIAKENTSGCEYNNDVMIWRNAPSTFDLLGEIVGKRDEYERHPMNWQFHICNMIRYKDSAIAKTNLVDEHVMNTFEPHWRDGDFIVHFYMYPYNDKIRLANEYLKKVKL
jgi:hypothetical protein